MDWVTTSTILERLRDFDDRDMWQQFAARFHRPLAAFVGRFGLNPDEVEDVVQETLLAFSGAYRRGKYARASGRLSSWLFGIAYRQAVNAQRKRAQAGARIADVGGQTSFFDRVPDESEAQTAWDADWEQATLETCLARVRGEVAENTYRVFELVVRQGVDPAAAATQLGMTRDAVYVAKHRVLKRLGELVRELEDASPAA